MCHSTPQQLCFPRPRADHACRWRGWYPTSDLEALLLRCLDCQPGLAERLAAAIRDKQHQAYIDHPLRALLAQRIYHIAYGGLQCRTMSMALRWEQSVLPGWGALVCILITVLTIHGIPEAAATSLR
jgi:hypothetical protein